LFISAQAKIFSPYPYGGVGGFDFDFNILTAFIRLGRAGPVGAGCPSYYYLTFLTLTLTLKIKK